MSDDDFTPEEEERFAGLDPNIRAEIKQNRSLRRQLNEQTKRGDEAERKLAFLSAGIDPADAKLSYFVRGYEGELNAEKIREAAVEAGFIEAPASGGGPSPEELAAMQRMEAAATGAQTLPPDREAELHARLREAKNEREFDAIYAEFGAPVAK